MLLPIKVARGVADGSMSLAFRRWRTQDMRPGATFKTAAGVIRVDSVKKIDPAKISDSDARKAGHKNADAVRARLAGDDNVPTYRVVLSWAGEDPRVALRENDRLDDDEVAAIDARLARLDRASSHGAWTMQTLDLIRRRPHTRAPDLAAEVGRERDPFKIDVRKLKHPGRTLRHPVGYERSPRGIAYLARTRYRAT